MKKKILFLLMSTLSYELTYAQNPKDSAFMDRKLFYEQGINFSQFAKQYLSFNNSTLTSNVPYLFTGNLVYKQMGFRYGINATINNLSSEDNTSNSGGATPANTSDTRNNGIDLRTGFFYYKRIAKRLVTHAGIDLLYSTLQSDVETVKYSSFSPGISTTSSGKVVVNSNSLGFGPFISIQYFVLGKLSIGTESSFYYFMDKADQKVETTTQTDDHGVIDIVSQSTSTKSNATRGEIKIPLNIFLYLRF